MNKENMLGKVVIFEGESITIAEEPYIDGYNDHRWYEARGAMQDGTPVIAYWDIIGYYDSDTEDDDLDCDWGNPESVSMI